MPTTTDYIYSIVNSFPNRAVNSVTLTTEIGLSSIVTALDHIDTGGDNCDVWFKDVLSTADKTTLDGVVAAHQGIPTPSSVKSVPVQLTKADGTTIPTASDGRPNIRNTFANRMVNFKQRVISFSTAAPTSVHNVNPVTDADYGDVTYKMYDANNALTTDTTLAVKTILDWVPAYNYEIIGGYIDLPTALKDGVTNQWYVSAIGVPDYTAAQGGSIDYISETNVEAVSTQRMTADGRSVSYMAYNYGGAPNTNKMRFIFKHPVGVSQRFMLYIEHYTT